MVKKHFAGCANGSTKPAQVADYSLDPCVEEELWDIWEFIARDNPDAATHVINAVYETMVTLADHPGMGRLRNFHSPRLKNIRSWRVSGFDNYLIFYRSVPKGIQVLHVYHGAWDIDRLLGEK